VCYENLCMTVEDIFDYRNCVELINLVVVYLVLYIKVLY